SGGGRGRIPSRPCGRAATTAASPVRPRDPRHVPPHTVVALPEAVVHGRLAQVHRRIDVLDLLPRHAHAVRAADAAGDPREPAALAPVAGADQERGDARFLAGAALDGEIVDVPAPAPVLVEQLVVEDVVA